MSTKERNFRIGVVIGYMLALLIGFIASNFILLPKWLDDQWWEPATDIMTGFYAEPENTLDVLFLGSSHVFCGVSPLTVQDETGIRSYDLASGLQRNWVAYHYLVEALKTQKPSIVVIDTQGIFEDSQNAEGRNRMALDYMKNSDNKWQAIRASMQPEESLISYVFPAIRFHERVIELTPEDFLWWFKADRHNYLHGYRLEYMNKKTPVTFMNEEESADGQALTWDDTCKSQIYMNKIIEICKANHISLVFVTIPTTEDWDSSRKLAISNYAKEQGADYIDFVPQVHQIGLSEENDFYDKTHLNIYGAEKFSRYLARILKERYFEATDFNITQTEKEQWETDYEKYQERLLQITKEATS